MKTLLILITLIPSICSAQLVFEVNAPSIEQGVFPCMAGKSSEWTNSPNLYQDGNWFSDTLVLADDGNLGSACSPLSNTISSNFALFYRSGCDVGQSLLNAQNAGATGAIVIDSVDGRPLPFDADALSNSISIPFVIISRGKGDSLIQRINENQDVVVSFGDKTGVNAIDVGIYKEFSLWSRYGIFPFTYYQLPDSLFGTWVYNHGTTDVDSLQVKLWFYHDPNYPQHNQESLSPYFNLAAGDSVFVDFNFEFTTTGDGYAIYEANPLNYGYEIIGINDEDSIDNKINQIIFGDDTAISNTFSLEPYNTNNYFDEVDYFIEGSPLGYDSMSYCLYMPFKYTNDFAYLCNPVVPLSGGGVGEEQALTTHEIFFDNQDQEVTFFNYTGQGFYYISGTPDSIYADFGSWGFFGSTPSTQSTSIGVSINTAGSTSLGYSSDMYHDEHIRQGHLPTFFRKDIFIDSSTYDPQYYLTPIVYIDMWHYPQCYWNVEEIKNSSISLSPNPTKNILTISSLHTIKSIAIYDLLGKKIVEFEGGNQLEKDIHVASLKSGCYLVEVIHESGKRLASRFIKE